MYELDLESAVSEIHQACEGKPGSQSPFFFIVGAGLSAPTIPIASEIEQECREIARGRNRLGEPKSKSFLESYSHWFEQAWPHAQQRQEYLRKKIENRQISPAALRLAHLLLDGAAGNLVVTPNFDDFLSKALQLFGRSHIICDHPHTINRVAIESNDIKIVHVHGTYWFYDCCNLKGEIADRAESVSTSGTVTVPAFLEHLLWNRSPIVLGYSGWEGDAIMTALYKRMKNAMGFNIYWFCFKRSDYDMLPPWLRNDPRVRFVMPKVEPAIPITKSVEPSLSAPQTVKGGSEMLETLPAVRVLDLLNRSFKLFPPPLTESPLEFFATQLAQIVFPETMEQQESDFYDFKNVIATIQRAAAWLKEQEKGRSEVERALEDLRNAVRRSEYREAIKFAGQISQANASDSQLEELLSAAFTAAESLSDSGLDKLRGYEIVCDISRKTANESISASPSFFKWARALLRKGFVLGELKRYEEAIIAYDEVVKRFGNATESAVREQAARALNNVGFILGKLNRDEEAIVTYDEVVRQFGDAPDPGTGEAVAKSLRNKGIVLVKLKRKKEAIIAYDEVIKRFGDATEPAVCEQVVVALRNKGAILGELKQPEDAIIVYDEVIKRFGDATEPAVREQVAMCLFSKGFVLGELKRREEAVVAYDEIVTRFRGATESVVSEHVAYALFNKGIALSELNSSKEAIAAYEELVRRYEDATALVLQRLIVKAMLSQAEILKKIRQTKKFKAKIADIIQRYGKNSDSKIQGYVIDAKNLMPKKQQAAGAKRA
ncbi:MAG TPA: tetratricopeptide repeat protein [Candidatus Angelobacter sp.]|jgi:tetratricopeptide (TPR) repeat protein